METIKSPSASLCSQYDNQQYSDFEINLPKSNMTLLLVHKVILASKSDYFNAFINSKTEDALNNTYIVDEEREDLFEIIVKSLYCDIFAVKKEDQLELIIMLDKYCFQDQKIVVINNFVNAVSVDNVFQIIVDLDLDNKIYQNLKSNADWVLRKHAVELLDTNFQGYNSDQIFQILVFSQTLRNHKGLHKALEKWASNNDGEIPNIKDLLSLLDSSPKRKINDCAICRSKLTEPCIDCFYDAQKKPVDCMIVKGSCDHEYHAHCLNRWLLKRLVCPLCNTEWKNE